jgi:hypothetical protein
MLDGIGTANFFTFCVDIISLGIPNYQCSNSSLNYNLKGQRH